MTIEEETRYREKIKKVWIIYTLIICCLIAFLVFVVADDNEEVLFYSVMTAGFAYVLRPEKAFIENAVKYIFGVDPPSRDKDGE
ncbi:MAG: hypothetical protein WBN40_14030 [Pseudomonadales bacterium]